MVFSTLVWSREKKKVGKGNMHASEQAFEIASAEQGIKECPHSQGHFNIDVLT
jgi:hypothetical protein